MSYSEIEARYRDLKAQFDAGTLSEDDFKARLQELMIQDDQGRWWIIGYETGQWYVHDGEQWAQAEPPTPPAPVEPLQPETSARPKEELVPVEPPPPETAAEPQEEAAPVADGAAPALWQQVPEPKVARVPLLEVPWGPLLIVAVGWGLGYLLEVMAAGWRIGFSLSRNVAAGWGVQGLLIGSIGGAATAWACQRAGRAWRRSQVVALVAGWAIVMGVTHWLVVSLALHSTSNAAYYIVVETMGMLVGGLLLIAILRRAGQSLTQGQMAIIAIGWALAYAVPSILANSSVDGFHYWLRGLSPPGPLWLVYGFAIGTIGGWVTLAQLVRSRRAPGEVEVEATLEAGQPRFSAMVFGAARWPRWVSVLIIAVGWGVGALVAGRMIDSSPVSQPVALGLAVLIGGAATAFICRRVENALRWNQVLLLPAGLFIVYWLLISVAPVYGVLAVILFTIAIVCAGPLLIGLVLRWANPAFRWRQVAILAVAWMLAGGIGLGVPIVVARDGSATLILLMWGLILGALGGWATLDQLARTRRAAADAPQEGRR